MTRASDAGGRAGLSGDVPEPDEVVRSVRPYTVTGGRTRTRRLDLPLEALVGAGNGGGGAATAALGAGLGLERRRILELTGRQILSVAELSAHLRLPLGVVRVLVSDLAEEGAVVVHRTASQTSDPATDLKVLEDVLNGISAL